MPLILKTPFLCSAIKSSHEIVNSPITLLLSDGSGKLAGVFQLRATTVSEGFSSRPWKVSCNHTLCFELFVHHTETRCSLCSYPSLARPARSHLDHCLNQRKRCETPWRLGPVHRLPIQRHDWRHDWNHRHHSSVHLDHQRANSPPYRLRRC